MAQKNEHKLLDLKIIAFQSGRRNSHNPEQDICHWQSMCYETPLTFNISLREIFSQSGSPTVMKKYDGTLDPLTCWLSKDSLKRCFLKSGLTKTFRVYNFRKKVAMTIISFLEMFKIWCRFNKLNKKIGKNCWF